MRRLTTISAISGTTSQAISRTTRSESFWTTRAAIRSICASVSSDAAAAPGAGGAGSISYGRSKRTSAASAEISSNATS